jgi:hypothetical protein
MSFARMTERTERACAATPFVGMVHRLHDFLQLHHFQIASRLSTVACLPSFVSGCLCYCWDVCVLVVLHAMDASSCFGSTRRRDHTILPTNSLTIAADLLLSS